MKEWLYILIFLSEKVAKSSAVSEECERGSGGLRSEEKILWRLWGSCVGASSFPLYKTNYKIRNYRAQGNILVNSTCPSSFMARAKLQSAMQFDAVSSAYSKTYIFHPHKNREKGVLKILNFSILGGIFEKLHFQCPKTLFLCGQEAKTKRTLNTCKQVKSSVLCKACLVLYKQYMYRDAPVPRSPFSIQHQSFVCLLVPNTGPILTSS